MAVVEKDLFFLKMLTGGFSVTFLTCWLQQAATVTTETAPPLNDAGENVNIVLFELEFGVQTPNVCTCNIDEKDWLITEAPRR